MRVYSADAEPPSRDYGASGGAASYGGGDGPPRKKRDVMHVKPAAIAVVALALGLAACSSGGGSRYGTGDPNLAAPNPGGGPIDPFLTDGRAVLAAFDAISERSGKPFRVTSVSADGVNGLSVDVQEPGHRVNVDRYGVGNDGTLSGPTPVKLTSLDGRPITEQVVDYRAFDPRSVGFERLTATARAAIAASHYPDARVGEWEFGGIHSDDRRFMYLAAARARPAAELGPNLQIVALHY